MNPGSTTYTCVTLSMLLISLCLSSLICEVDVFNDISYLIGFS